MLIENVQNLINTLEGQNFYLNGFSCKVENGDLYWNSGSNEENSLDLNAMSQNDLSELYNRLIDIEA